MESPFVVGTQRLRVMGHVPGCQWPSLKGVGEGRAQDTHCSQEEGAPCGFKGGWGVSGRRVCPLCWEGAREMPLPQVRGSGSPPLVGLVTPCVPERAEPASRGAGWGGWGRGDPPGKSSPGSAPRRKEDARPGAPRAPPPAALSRVLPAPGPARLLAQAQRASRGCPRAREDGEAADQAAPGQWAGDAAAWP